VVTAEIHRLHIPQQLLQHRVVAVVPVQMEQTIRTISLAMVEEIPATPVVPTFGMVEVVELDLQHLVEQVPISAVKVETVEQVERAH
jgi:hypothetical protein